MSSCCTASERKCLMYSRTQELFSSHNNYMLVNVQRVKSTQLKDAKSCLDPRVKLLFAKNKIIKKALNDLDSKKYEKLIEQLHGNVAVAFYDNVDPRSVMEVSKNHMRQANAIAGDIAPSDVIIPAGPTGLGPEKINIFQAARMNTKINKGKIDLVSDHKLLSGGDVVTLSDANLLQMLKIKPFEFGLSLITLFEGKEIYSKELLMISNADIEKSLQDCCTSLAAISLGAGISTPASVPYEIKNAFANVAKVSLALGFKIKELPN